MDAIYIWLAQQVNKLLRYAGAMIVGYPLPANRRRSSLLSRYGISLVVDIGANAGQYGYRLRDHGYQGRIISYEPLPDAYRELLLRCKKDRLWRAENMAVADATGSITLHVTENSESSSVLPILKRHIEAAEDSRVIATVEARTITLDDILCEFRDAVVMLKIDTQGYEQHVLRSGRKHLRTVALIEIELSLVPLYEGQMLFRDIDSLLLEAGFRLVSLEEGFFDRRTGELLQVDAIYANADASTECSSSTSETKSARYHAEN